MSQMAGPEIVRMRRSQFALAREMLTRAFLDYPLMKYANAQRARRRWGVATLYGAIVRDTLWHGEVHVSAGLLGACCWLPPGVGLPTFARELRSGMAGLPFGFGWAGFQRLVNFDHVQRSLHERYAIGPHWFLATIGVDPAHQGRGIGKRTHGAGSRPRGRTADVLLSRNARRRQRPTLRATRVSSDGAHRKPGDRPAVGHAASARAAARELPRDPARHRCSQSNT